jgi:midasin
MNPSGDWGKKELTPALRSRFTEIFTGNPLSTSEEELLNIIFSFFTEFQDS